MEHRKVGRPRGRTVGHVIGVRVPPDLEAALRRRSEAEDRPLAGLVRQAIRHYLGGEVDFVEPEETDLKEAKAS